MRHASALLAAGLVLYPAIVHGENVMSSYYDGKRYDFVFTCSWKEEDPQPPLAARAALTAARSRLSQLVADAPHWAINRISLRSACSNDKWFYVIEFIPPREGLNAGLGLVVFMSGYVLEPKVSPWRPNP